MAKKIDYASLYTLRKDGRYVGTYTDEYGKRHHVYDKDPEQLHKKLEIATAKKESHIPTFAEVSAAWEAEHREEIEERTWRNYKPHYEEIINTIGDRTFSEITALEISNDLSRLKANGYSATIVRSRRSLYRMIFDYAVVHGYAPYNPITSIRLPKGLPHSTRKSPTTEQMETICNSIDAPFGLFPFLLLCTGMRKSEALALRWDDVDFTAKEIHITKSLDYTNGENPKYKSPKTEAGYRTIPIVDVLLPHLKAAKQESKSDLLFPQPSSNRGGKGGGLMSERAYDGAWKRYCEATGLTENGRPVLTAHNLRHGTATLMFELGVDELTAQKILGHSRIEVTREIYTDLRRQQKVKSIKKLNTGLSKMLSSAKK